MFWRRRRANDFAAEIDEHLRFEAERFREQGLSDGEALLAARRSFGNVTAARERFYESHRFRRFWDVLWQDLRFGARMLGKNRGLTIVAILTLAFGIGANTAIFSLLNAVLLRDLPVRAPEELVLFGNGRGSGSVTYLLNGQLFSYPFYRDFRRANTVFSDVTAVQSILLGLHGRVGGATQLESIKAELVSGTFFRTLGVNPAVGRVFGEADDRIPGGHPVVVASYGWWQRRFANHPDAVGTKVTIGATVYTIIGITPPEFFGVNVGQAPELWIPLTMEKEISPAWNGLDNPRFQSLHLLARLKPGVTVQQANGNTDLIYRQLAREYIGPQPSPKNLADISRAHIELTSASAGLSGLRRSFSTPLKILMVVVALVLLVACANVANLLLARAAARQREVATRMSLGANRSRLIRQLLVESGLLGLAGGGLGVLLASQATRLLLSMVSPAAQPASLSVAPDAMVLVFTLVVSILTVIFFGTAPAFYATRLELVPSLKDGRGSTASPDRSRLARWLVVGQVGLSLALLVV